MDLLRQELITVCFTSLKLFLMGEELRFSSHAAVIGAFGREFSKTERLPRQFHRYLIDASRIRSEGDYSTARTITAGEAFETISRAEEFIQLADRL